MYHDKMLSYNSFKPGDKVLVYFLVKKKVIIPS